MMQAAREHLQGIYSPQKRTKTQKKIWAYLKLHPDKTDFRAIARRAGVMKHTAAKRYEISR